VKNTSPSYRGEMHKNIKAFMQKKSHIFLHRIFTLEEAEILGKNALRIFIQVYEPRRYEI
jgi:hypothetical protein